MKILFTLLALLLSFVSLSHVQGDTTMLKSNWKKTNNRKKAKYLKTIQSDSAGNRVLSYYTMDNKINRIVSRNDKGYNGFCSWFYTDGSIKKEGYYLNNKKHGEFHLYTQSGKLRVLKNYENDSITKLVHYDTITGTILKQIEGKENFPDVDAQYVGGPKALQMWITENVNYPTEAVNKNKTGRVYISFVVEPDGSISNVKVLKSVCKSLDNEAIRLVKSMPKWIPGEVEGEFARTRCQIPINFTLDYGKSEKKGRRK